MFCGNDGSPLKSSENVPAEESAPSALCKVCGEKVGPDELFCPKCGAKVHGQGSPDSVQRRRAPETEEAQFTLGSHDSFDRALEEDRPQGELGQAETNKTEELRSKRKVRRRLYAAGGAILAVALVAIFAVPRIIDFWNSGGRGGLPDVPSSPQSSPAPAEPAAAPGLEGATAAPASSPKQTEQTPSLIPPQNPAEVASKESSLPSKSTRQPSKASVPSKPELAARKETSSPPYSESAKAGESKQAQVARKEETTGALSKNTASFKETPIPRRQAEPGTYETIRTAVARRDPNDSAEIVDQIEPRTRLTVTGSQGDWLVVYSKTRNRTVYVKRDDAMFISEKSSTVQSGRDLEVKWKELERQIQQAISNQGITGVSVSFIRDTAYLKGTVQTENQRFTAEQAARSFPEVLYIYNGIWVNR